VKRFVLNSRQLGFGLSDKIVTSETIGVGVAIKDRDGKAVAAISVAGIAQRMGEKRQKEIAALIESEIMALRFSSD
jgi:DNA-binding IclR family transcriptional regulator